MARPNKKPRGESLLGGRLTPEQKDELMTWLMIENASYEEIVGRVGDWGISTSASALSQLRERHGLSWKLEKAKQQALQAVSALPEDVEEHVRKGLLQQLFQAFYSDLSAMDLSFLARAENDRRRLDLQERKLVLDEKKFEAAMSKEAKAKDVLGSNELTPEEKNQRLKEVYGIQ